MHPKEKEGRSLLCGVIEEEEAPYKTVILVFISAAGDKQINMLCIAYL